MGLRSLLVLAMAAAIQSAAATPLETTSSGLPPSCTYRPTATVWATVGCDLSCDSSIRCIVDNPVVLPCGCTRAAVSPVTTTICPTSTPCYQCHTGWGIATVTDTSCPPNATPHFLE